MPCKIKVKVLAGRNLPVMDRAGDTTDAFVEIKFAGITHKTDVCRKSLNPHWSNTEWYRFEVDESELQDEPLQLRLMDHDTYSANDAIGKVVISLAPLLAKEANSTKGNAAPQGGAVMSGWIPVFDTMHGIRGELNIIVKVELFSDFNKYKTSSCGVQFFHCSTIPPGYRVTGIHGFVEELVVNDDPEYQWIDKIRTPRASNEARQVAFIKLSNQVQRLVGLKAAELGANAVMGYQQDFDLEGEAGVVARAIGTAVSITPLPTPSQPLNIPLCTQQEKSEKDREKEMGSPRHARHESFGGKDAHVNQNTSINAASTPVGIHRRSSDSDLSVTPKGGSLNTSIGNAGSGGGAILRPSMNSNNLDMLEYPFITMSEYPPGFIVHLGGTVCARSVKLLHGVEEAASRAAWWTELRTELRAHARALVCNAVVKYSDSAVMCEDVCILSASGTAAVINLDCDFNADGDPTIITTGLKEPKPIEEEKLPEIEPCSVAHVPYSPGTGPYRAELSLCGVCRRARVPAVLLSTCAKPKQLASYGKSVYITAVASRIRRAPPNSEPGARDISDQLPFLEYELHKLLLAKLRMQGANALFNVTSAVSCGPRCVVAVAAGAAHRLAALPPPAPPALNPADKDKEAVDLQKKLWETFQANKVINGYDVTVEQVSNGGTDLTEEAPALDLCADKDACLLELDDADDVETAKSLAVRRQHMQLYEPSLKITNAPPYAFAQVCRGRVVSNSSVSNLCSRALDTVSYKLRRLAPYVIAAPVLRVDLPDDEIQLMVSGTAISLADPSSPSPRTNNNDDDEDDLFTLDEEHTKTEEDKNQFITQDRTSVRISSSVHPSVTPAVGKAVCALRLLFVRETTAVRELGGLSGFLHTFTCEVLAIVRAYTAALGGNTLSSFYITQLMLQDNAHKNQGQCLLSVGGDVIHVNY